MKKVSLTLIALISLICISSSVFAVTISRIDTTTPSILPIVTGNPLDHVAIDKITNFSVDISKIGDPSFTTENITDAICTAINNCDIADLIDYYTKAQSDARFYPLNSNPRNYINDTTWQYNQTVPAIDFVVNNYYNMTASDLRYYPLNSNPHSYINDTTWQYNQSQPVITWVSQNYYNKTVSDDRFRLHVYVETVPVTTVGGVGSNTSAVYDDWVITKVVYAPSNINAVYKAEVYESASLIIVDKDRASHKGEWGIEKYHALVNDSVTVNITNSNPDTTYQVNITYVKNGDAV